MKTEFEKILEHEISLLMAEALIASLSREESFYFVLREIQEKKIIRCANEIIKLLTQLAAIRDARRARGSTAL